MKFKRFAIIIIAISIFIGALPYQVFADRYSKYFNDLSEYSWAEESINNLYEYGIISGSIAPTETDLGKFNPSSRLTKAELSILLFRMIPTTDGLPKEYSSDNLTSTWYQDSVAVLDGISVIEQDVYTNKIYPDSYVSREECFYVLSQFIKYVYDEELSFEQNEEYYDYKEISTRYVSSLDSIVNYGLAVGSNNKISPKSFLTRAEIAVLLNKLIQKHSNLYNKVDFIIPCTGRGLTGYGYDGVVSDREYSEEIINIITNFVANEVGTVQDSQIGKATYHRLSYLETFDHPASIEINKHDLRYMQTCVARNMYEYYETDTQFISWVKN